MSKAECASCGLAINGNWNMTQGNPSYQKQGRYLGVDGYMWNYGSYNWVYCFC